jgi:uncharacterized protein related to proFAR isomerase
MVNRDKKSLDVRNGMAIALWEAVRQGNEGDTLLMRKTIHKISQTEGFRVLFGVDLEEDVYVYGKRYTAKDKTILITENGKRLFVIYKDDGVTGLDVEHFMLMSESELAEHSESLKHMNKSLDRKFEINEDNNICPLFYPLAQN